jgi:hypothetical protein
MPGDPVTCFSFGNDGGEAIMLRTICCGVAALGFLAVSILPLGAQGALVAEGEKAGHKITIRDLKRDDGGTVTLRFRMSNDNEKPEGIYQLLGGYLDDRVHLIDAANKKKYLVVKDSSGKCECTAVKGNVTKDGPVNLWAKFPAPPESVQKITVVVGGFEPVESVPITGR